MQRYYKFSYYANKTTFFCSIFIKERSQLLTKTTPKKINRKIE